MHLFLTTGAVLGLPRLTRNLSELLASAAPWGKEIRSHNATFCGACLCSFCDGEASTAHSFPDVRLVGFILWHTTLLCFARVPLLRIADVLFAVGLLLRIEPPAFWGHDSPRAHSSVAIISPGPTKLYAKLGRFLQLFTQEFNLAQLLSVIKSFLAVSTYLYYPKEVDISTFYHLPSHKKLCITVLLSYHVWLYRTASVPCQFPRKEDAFPRCENSLCNSRLLFPIF